MLFVYYILAWYSGKTSDTSNLTKNCFRQFRQWIVLIGARIYERLFILHNIKERVSFYLV